MGRIEVFKSELIKAGVLEQEGSHHEFTNGEHGRKLEFECVDKRSSLFKRWVEVCATDIRDRYGDDVFGVVGVANGTNRLALPIAQALGDAVLPFRTRKISHNKAVLDEVSVPMIKYAAGGLLVVVEDVGTTGGTVLTVVEDIRSKEIDGINVAAQITWQRQPELHALENAGIPYSALINEQLPTYRPEECLASGYCAQGWGLVPYPR